MYLARLTIENFRCFGSGERRLSLELSDGFTALVGENDTGKTAVIDALRFVLGTRDQENTRATDDDFYCSPENGERSTEINIRCEFRGLTTQDKSAFAEYLTYVEPGSGDVAVLHINWTARNLAAPRSARRWVAVEVRSGNNGVGPAIDPEARSLLRATYLRPLRDAERAMSAGRGSRLSQILQNTRDITDLGEGYESGTGDPDIKTLSVLGVGDYASELLRTRKAIRNARARLNKNYLTPLSFAGDELAADIDVSMARDSGGRLRQILEKLELGLRSPKKSGLVPNRGLGSNNLLFMACELLLLGAEEDGFPMLLIEEPEAHLHPQRQLRLMRFLQDRSEVLRSDGQKIQTIVTTHSPNLASAIRLPNLVLIVNGKAFPLSCGATELKRSDYGFLERFLDVTKGNLFFARGVMIVEGSSENILFPAIAHLINRDFTEHGVSVINVGGTGLSRFARIFQRKNQEVEGVIDVPVACVVDLDVMPDCAPEIVGYVERGKELPKKEGRNWRVRSDFSEEELEKVRNVVRTRADGQNVRTFVSDQWTLEFALARCGLGQDVWVSACLAKAEERIGVGGTTVTKLTSEAERSYGELEKNFEGEELAARVYAQFVRSTRASKPIAAQYLSRRLEKRVDNGDLDMGTLEKMLPSYLLEAIKYVTRSQSVVPAQVDDDGARNG